MGPGAGNPRLALEMCLLLSDTWMSPEVSTWLYISNGL